jgi:hypothetical protein
MIREGFAIGAEKRRFYTPCIVEKAGPPQAGKP